MPMITHLGDGIFFALVTLVLLIWRWRVGVLFVLAGIIQAIVSYLLKRKVFSDMSRPKKFFEGVYDLNFIEGVEVHSRFAFPSGHTMTAFLMATLLALIFLRRVHWSVLLLMLAILVGFSRIYILQHFYRDVVAGSLVGVLLALGIYYFLGPALKVRSAPLKQ
jgi:membrane-associated phospholipid phosphatase